MKSPVKLKRIFLFLFVVCSLPLMAQEEGREIFSKAVDQLLTGQMELTLDIQTTDQKGRVKEKGYNILMATFGDVEKTRMFMEKPERAKGITIIMTNTPGEVGQIEIYTPANGKTRKMKATPENMDRVGSNFVLSDVASHNPADLNIKLLGTQEINGENCYKLEIMDEGDSVSTKSNFMVEESTFHIVQIDFFDEKGNQTHTTTLEDYQAVEGTGGKIQPMVIHAEDLKAKTHTSMQVVKAAYRPDLKEEEFVLLETSE